MRTFGRAVSVNGHLFKPKKIVALVTLLSMVIFAVAVNGGIKPNKNFAVVSADLASITTKTNHRSTNKQKPTSKPKAIIVTPTPKNCQILHIYKLSATGLTTQSASFASRLEGPNIYQIHGSSLEQLRQQLTECAPTDGHSGERYLADTSYSLSWRFEMLADDDGQCRVVSPSVGIRIRQILPSWSDSSSSSSLKQSWQSFITNLKTHEAGHNRLDLQYAKQILNLMQTYPTNQDCGTLKANLTNIVNKKMAALELANVRYDQITDHGATQGAVL